MNVVANNPKVDYHVYL